MKRANQVWSRFAIVYEVKAARCGSAFICGFGDAQVTRSVLEITVFHECFAGAFAANSVATNEPGQQLSADQLSGLTIGRTNHALIILLTCKNLLCLFGHLCYPFAPQTVARRN